MYLKKWYKLLEECLKWAKEYGLKKVEIGQVEVFAAKAKPMMVDFSCAL